MHPNDPSRVPSLINPTCLSRKALVAATLFVGLLASRNAYADSFFDIFVDAWNSGQVVMQPVNSGAYPFPPPPLNFPDLGAASTIDIEMVSLGLRSSQPMVVGAPDPTGRFTVDSFFDIFYEINASNGGGSTHVVDSFFDITYRMDVIPGRSEILPTGEEIREFDIEMVSLGLTGSHPIDLTPDPDFDLGIQLVEGQAAGLDGHVTVLKLAGGGGNTFTVDSFFDVFVELSIDGGPPVASTENSQLRLQSVVNVPEPSTFCLLAIGTVAAVVVRRRRKR